MHIKPEGITVISVGKQVETAQQFVFYRCRPTTAERPFSQHTLTLFVLPHKFSQTFDQVARKLVSLVETCGTGSMNCQAHTKQHFQMSRRVCKASVSIKPHDKEIVHYILPGAHQFRASYNCFCTAGTSAW